MTSTFHWRNLVGSGLSNFQFSTEQGLVLKIPSDAVGEFGSEWGNGVGGVS